MTFISDTDENENEDTPSLLQADVVIKFVDLDIFKTISIFLNSPPSQHCCFLCV